MDSLPGRLARRALIGAGLAIVLVLPASAPAAPDSVVATVGSRYVPGDNQEGTLVFVVKGGGLNYTNLDIGNAHSVTSDIEVAIDTPLFDSGRLESRRSAPVAGVESLAAGRYGFHCSIHDGMRGTIEVIGS